MRSPVTGSPNPANLESAPLLRNSNSNPFLNQRSYTYPGARSNLAANLRNEDSDEEMFAEPELEVVPISAWDQVSSILPILKSFLCSYQVMFIMIWIIRATVLLLTMYF